jgi:Domain of unknown function (DUF4349)
MTRGFGLAILAMAIAIGLVACSQAASEAGLDGGGGAAAPSAPADEAPRADGGTSTDGASGGDSQGQDGQGGQEGLGDFAPIEQRVIKTGEVGLVVDDVAIILARVRAMAVELGGYVGGSQAGTGDESATITLRIPAERFDEVLTRLQELPDVEVVSMSTREEDVTNQVVDLQARIRNLEASEASYRVLFDRAQRIEDILTVQGRLDEVRGRIEQLEAQLQAVEGQAALSSLTVSLIPRDEPVAEVQAGWDPGAQASKAVAALVGIAQGLFDVLTWIVIVILPLAVVLSLVALGAIRLVPELRRRLERVEAEAPGK